MSIELEKILKLTDLRYKNLPLVMEATKSTDGVLGEIIRVHLVTEFFLDELIRFALNENAQAILSLNLKYSQKLELVGQLQLISEINLIPDYVKGSLKKLNSLRNKVAHNLNAPVDSNDIKNLFVGLESELPYNDVIEHGHIIALTRYLSFIFGHMFPKYERDNNET